MKKDFTTSMENTLKSQISAVEKNPEFTNWGGDGWSAYANMDSQFGLSGLVRAVNAFQQTIVEKNNSSVQKTATIYSKARSADQMQGALLYYAAAMLRQYNQMLEKMHQAMDGTGKNLTYDFVHSNLTSQKNSFLKYFRNLKVLSNGGAIAAWIAMIIGRIQGIISDTGAQHTGDSNGGHSSHDAGDTGGTPVQDTDNGNTSTGTSDGRYNETYCDVPLQGQQTSYTCGSASGCMILGSLGVSVSESDFYGYANSNGQGTYVYRIKDTLNHFLGRDAYSYVDTSAMSTEDYFNTIRNSLANGYPVQVVAKIPSGSAFGYSTGGHYFVITGVYQNADGEFMARVNDPWTGQTNSPQQIEVKLSDIQTYNRNHSGYIICNK